MSSRRTSEHRSESESSYLSSGSSSTEHEAEVEEVAADSESEVEEDPYVKFLDMDGSQYTDEDPIYTEELSKTCPPAPLFVLRWNRANNPRSFNNRTNNRSWEQQGRSRQGNYGHDHRQERSK